MKTNKQLPKDAKRTESTNKQKAQRGHEEHRELDAKDLKKIRGGSGGLMAMNGNSPDFVDNRNLFPNQSIGLSHNELPPVDTGTQMNMLNDNRF